MLGVVIRDPLQGKIFSRYLIYTVFLLWQSELLHPSDYQLFTCGIFVLFMTFGEILLIGHLNNNH